MRRELIVTFSAQLDTPLYSLAAPSFSLFAPNVPSLLSRCYRVLLLGHFLSFGYFFRLWYLNKLKPKRLRSLNCTSLAPRFWEMDRVKFALWIEEGSWPSPQYGSCPSIRCWMIWTTLIDGSQVFS